MRKIKGEISMLVNETEYSIMSFIEEFQKRFSNFCTKSPVLLTFHATIDSVVVIEQGTNKSLTYKFDHAIGVKQNIKAIKDWLVENTYPIMIQEKKDYSEYSVDEIEKLISETGIAAEQAVLMKKETITKTTWKIVRILVKKDELFVKNLSNNREFRFRMTCPSTLFLRNLRSKWNPTSGWEFFEKHSYVLNEIVDIVKFEE